MIVTALRLRHGLLIEHGSEVWRENIFYLDSAHDVAPILSSTPRHWESNV